MHAEPDSLVALVTHARHVTAAERGAFATRLQDRFGQQALILETCHRVEAYVVSAPGDMPPAGLLPAGGRVHVGDAAIRHAIAVGVGRDSVVVGEDQILYQLRESVGRARAEARLAPVLERLFAMALRAGRHARSWRSGPALSLADIALSEVERRTGPVSGREVLVVGAGKMGVLAMRAAAAAGASVSVANRTPGRASNVVAAIGARIGGLDPGPAIDRFAAAVVALSGPWLIGQATVNALASSSTIVVDLSVPTAIPRELVDQLGPRVISADELALMDVTRQPADDRTVARLDALIDATAAEFRVWLEAHHARMAAETLTVRADRERRVELDALWRRLPGLDAESRDEIDRMSRHLARRLLREPLERLGRDSDGRHERAARELFGL